MKRTITKIIIAVMLVTVLLTGCRDKSGRGKKTEAPDQAQTAVTETASAEKEDAVQTAADEPADDGSMEPLVDGSKEPEETAETVAAESDVTPPEFEIPVTGQKWENEDLAVWLTTDGILHMESVNQEPLEVSFAGASRNGIAVDVDDLNRYLHRLDDSSGFREEMEIELTVDNSGNWWPCGVNPYEYTVRLQVTKNPESESPEEYETENISLLKPAQWTAKGSGEVIGEQDGLRLEFIGIVPGDYRSDIYVGATNVTDHIVYLSGGNNSIAVIPGAQAVIDAGRTEQEDAPGASREFHYDVRDAGMDNYETRTIAYSLPETIGDTEIGGIAGELLEIIHSEADVYGAYRYEDGTIRKMAALVRTEDFVREMVEHNGVWTSPGEIFCVDFDSRGIWWKDTLFYYKAENRGTSNIIAECGVSGSMALEEMATRYITSEDLNHSEEAPAAEPDEPADASDASRESDESHEAGTEETAAEG